ncbi:MAG: 2OG-Fe(II) oxygenase [Sphingomonadaceae bacterium]|nr:2OG-Fe(II) oxygenase [Sphingomonadaceae bacterium]
MKTTFALNPALDVPGMTRRFLTDGRLSIEDFLEPQAAEALHHALTAREDWVCVINAGDKVFELGKTSLDSMSAEQHSELTARIYREARDGFQFRFSSIRVPDSRDQRQVDHDIVHAFAEFMSSAAVLDLLQRVTGRTGLVFADAQATAYHPGDFLTGHDDDVEGKHRELAYVFGLTPHWRTEWGGLLLFHGEGGAVEGFVPQFNCLNIFALPTLHSVSIVAPFAGEVRYSVTGWLRTQRP